MKLKNVFPVAGLCLFSSLVSAETYQSFADFEFGRWDFSGEKTDVWSLGSRYYFDEKETLGPLNEFEFINRTSFISANYNRFEDDNVWGVGGDLFVDRFLVGANFNRIDNDDLKSARLGYLITDDFLVSVEASKWKETDTDYYLNAKYNLQLEGNDYIGFDFTTDEKFDYKSAGAKYFTALDGGRYLTAGLSYADRNSASLLSANLGFYFNRFTSAEITLDDERDYSVGFKHFFNENIAVTASYSSSDKREPDWNVWQVGLSAQF